ncbi:hypothetical protein CM50_18895 [Bacillus subtilis]|nr:hypothetical protein CM50_18895 [Bacillus subtilis] [Bacillus stercoris]
MLHSFFPIQFERNDRKNERIQYNTNQQIRKVKIVRWRKWRKTPSNQRFALKWPNVKQGIFLEIKE